MSQGGHVVWRLTFQRETRRMKQVRQIAGVLVGVAALVGASAHAQEAELSPDIAATTQQLIDDALSDEVGLQFVEDLTTEVGARLAGRRGEQVRRL